MTAPGALPDHRPGRYMVHEEDLLVTDDGPELLTRRATAELPVL